MNNDLSQKEYHWVEPKEVFSLLENNETFQRWRTEHQNLFISHLFTPFHFIQLKETQWEVGFFDPQEKKVTVFFQQEDTFSLRAPEKVFQEKGSSVDPLVLEKTHLSLKQAIFTFQQQVQQQFPALQIQEGFVVLQTLQQKTLWNISGITASFSVVNAKINAEDGTLVGIQEIEVVEKEQGKKEN